MFDGGGTDDDCARFGGNGDHGRKIAKSVDLERVGGVGAGDEPKIALAKNEKQVLHGVSGIAEPGEVLAIMGESGAGKTTLMNVLTQRNLKSLAIEGEVTINGEELSPNELQRISSYVQQADLFTSSMTVHEHLMFSARLRMGSRFTSAEKKARVEQLIVQMNLALKDLAKQGKTIILTIHQPSSQVFDLFDKLCLMAVGDIVYLGPAKKVRGIFKKAGYPLRGRDNPAEFCIGMLAHHQDETEEDRKDRIQKIQDAYNDSNMACLYKKRIFGPTSERRQKFGNDDIRTGERRSDHKRRRLESKRVAADQFVRPTSRLVHQFDDRPRTFDVFRQIEDGKPIHKRGKEGQGGAADCPDESGVLCQHDHQSPLRQEHFPGREEASVICL
uniref:AAA+ ATPase domain-containing protein n=1 Tax=Panagrolaimus sp. JU765 TaxID=591449 RepID=A0AC34R6N0_9BILA